ncbi:MAG: glutamine amidotransferase [Gimesia sp.]
MNCLAQLQFGAPQWTTFMVVMIFLGGLLVIYAYRSLSLKRAVFGSAMFLKFCGITVLSVALIEPLWSGVQMHPGTNLFVVAVDNSRSLKINDPETHQPRLQIVEQLLTTSQPSSENKQPQWLIDLEQSFSVRKFSIDAHAHAQTDLQHLFFDGPQSNLVSSLNEISERYKKLPLAGILLMTDGISNENLKRQDTSVPIYPVVIGSDVRATDVAIINTSVSYSPFEDAPIRILADLSATQCQNKIIKVQLLDEADKIVKTVLRNVTQQDQQFQIRFQVRPEETGIAFYQIKTTLISSEHEEATLSNNNRTLKIDRGRTAHRVLYVSGRPNWEFKFLRRALEQDEFIQLVGLIRIAKKETKFDFRSRDGEEGNALFRGFDQNNESDLERYDQPVFVRINTQNPDELREGFPKTETELFQYEAIIIDDLEAAFFTQDQLKLITRFVSERGGGLVMLGGQESFQRGGYHKTELSRLLPVYFSQQAATANENDYQFSLTRDGWLQPWMRHHKNEEDEHERLAEMPAFKTINQVDTTKPGATLSAVINSSSKVTFPAIATQRYGSGRVAAVMIGDLWRWRLKEDSTTPQLNKSWRQLLRWMTTDVLETVDLLVQENLNPNGGTKIQVLVRDPEFQKRSDYHVELEITTPDNKHIKMSATPVTDHPGMYQSIYLPSQPGGYTISAMVTAPDSKIKTIHGGWVHEPDQGEFPFINPNLELLQGLAEKSKGEVITAANLHHFVNTLDQRHLPITEEFVTPLWHHPLVLSFVLCCLFGEWSLRRWKGLP